jgi:hypothetical protein
MNLEVYVIEPKPNETEEEFISRCIANEINDGYPQDQAVAICYSKWENKNYKQNKKENKMKLKFEIKATLADGTPIYVSALEVGGEVRVVDENGDSVPVFDAEHVLSDGTVVVTVDGKITEIKPKAEAMEEVIESEDVIEEEMAVDPILDEAAILAIIQPKLDELYAVIAELKNAIESEPEIEVELKKENISLADAFAQFKKINK